MKVGKAVRVLRAARNLSQKELGAASGLDPSYVSLVESDKRDPSDATVRALAAGLRVPKHMLLLLGSPKEELAGTEQFTLLAKELLSVVLDGERSHDTQAPPGHAR